MKPYIDITESAKKDAIKKMEEAFKKNFVENYSLFVGINVYLPRIIVRIFVDFE